MNLSLLPQSPSLEASRARILHWKTKRQALILAHNYQSADVQDLADYTGDSLELARLASRTPAEVIVFCGVRFMAESAKILSPEKTVLLPVAEAGCPLADTIKAEDVQRARQQHPSAAVVAYVNSSAEVKAEADVCCTSANAVSVVNALPQTQVIFVPDKNLADWVARHTSKQIIPWPGTCCVHHQVQRPMVAAAREQHPLAPLLVHPECRPEICAQADAVLSTSGMLHWVRDSQAQEFIIGTEIGLLHRLQQDHPGKKFHVLASNMICPDMKRTTLEDLAHALEFLQYPVEVPAPIRKRAAKALAAMLQIQ